MTEFCGIEVEGRVVAASCPATESLANIIACAEHGASAVILKSASGARLGDKGTRRCHLDGTGFWAESGFDREIMPLAQAAALMREATAAVRVPVAASVTEMTLAPGPWLASCAALEKAGADVLQLDFFYLPNLLSDRGFADRFIRLLREIRSGCRVPVMPKLNIGLPADYAAYLLGEAGVGYVSLLDSIRSPSPAGAYLTGESLSMFGSYMLPVTRQYTQTLSKAGLSVCAGGGVTGAEQAAELIRLGAETVQIATEALLHGFARFGEIDDEIPARLAAQKPQPAVRPRKAVFDAERCTGCGRCRTQTFCAIAGSLAEGNHACEGCGFCAQICPGGAIAMRAS